MGKVLKHLVEMMKEYPDGIPLKKVAIVYAQKYRKNLTLATLGVSSMESLVASLDGHLVMEGELVFHKTHKPKKAKALTGAVASAEATRDSRPATPKRSRSQSGKGPPLPTPGTDLLPQLDSSSHNGTALPAGISFGGPSDSAVPSSSTCCTPPIPAPSMSRSTEELTQEQLLQRVVEVMKRYAFIGGSVEQLQACYFQDFGEQLPMEQYMSLYDNWEASRSKTAPNVLQLKTNPWNVPLQKAAVTQNPEGDPETDQKQTIPSNPLSDSDFPALGAEMKQTKDQRTKQRNETQRESSASVFREAYHAQLREVHRANVRAAEALEEDEEDLTGRRRNRALDLDMVNSLVEDVIREIAAEGELVTKERVISRVCMLMQVPSLESSRIKPWKVPALKDLQYVLREINMFLESTEAVTAICTLYELGQSLAALKDKKHYEELNLGPLCKFPLIHRMFKIDSNTKDDDIRQIETVDILKHLRIFRRKQTKPKVDLAEFMKYLADQYSCDSPYELGIRIHSIGLPIATLIKVSRCEHTIMEKAQQAIQKELEEEAQERMRKMKKNVMESVQGQGAFNSMGSLELRKKYVGMTAAEVVLEVFTNAAEVFSSKMAKRVQDFLLHVSGDRLATALFQLAICGGSLATPPDLVPKDKASKSTEQNKREDKLATALPSEAAVKQFLKDSLSNQHSAIALVHIASLEKKLAKHFQVKEFISLEQGTFLDFLVKHIQLLQETVGGAVSLSSSNVEIHACGFRVSRQDVFEFIKQCGAITSTDTDGLSHVESALRCHYGVRDSRDLGFGPLRILAGHVQRQRDMLAGGGPSQVFYESALFAKHSSTSTVCESVGLLGDMAQAQAKASLLSCPLLEDLSEWSQWELVFKPLYGPLRDFIERYAANTDLAALEVSPGVLLRITTHTGDKLFSHAVTNLDPIGTAGHLVSIVVADGIADAPTALLANHMESSLAAAVAKEALSQAEEDMSCYRTVARFVLDCLIRIPTRTCQALLQQVFLEPFSRVLGQAKSKQVLLTMAQSDPRHLNCLHRLGILLGITDWVKDYHNKLTPAQSKNYMCPTPVDQIKSNLVDSKSSSLSALNMSEDEDLEDTTMDLSFSSSNLNQNSHQTDGEQEAEEEEDEEELYELSSLPNGEIHINSETEGSQEEEHSDSADPDEESAASSLSESSENLQKAIIEDIRKSEFGIGVELTAEGQKLMKGHQDRLGRSLDRLSTELYSKDTHFVLELIQNADDNSYPSAANTPPALAFVVERDCITVLNNETGFQEKNIRAICDVGCSTKGKHKYGYIGQKGIGFKSVFKVTDCPEIHSNGFHLRFDKTCGPMGYILPHWMEDERPLDTQLMSMNQNSWTTKICLPLRSESHQTRNLFHDVHPSLLLFLHRLRSITIYNQSDKRLVTMTRRDLSHNVLEVEHTEGTERWLVVKGTLQPKKIKEDVESTELALAFQLDNDNTDDIRCQPQQQPVFAFLPLRSFGFRFIVQGDFDIPSSREDVDRDSSWNQWLRSEIPQLFLKAMDVFNDHPEFSGLKGVCHFLQFVPLPGEVLDFFKPVAGQIIQLLKGKAFLPTLSSDGSVVYKLPSQVAVCQDTVIRDVIGGDELDRHLSLAYLHPNLHPAPPTSLLTHLGVRYLRGSDVTTVTTAMAKELVQGEGIHADGGLRRLARLLVCNFRALEHGYGEADTILQTLRDLPIIPLADGRVVALSGEGVFFPMEEAKTKKKKAQAQTGPFSALYKDVSVVHPSLLSCVEPLESQQVRELLRKLGVHELEPHQLLEQHIYPAIRNDRWKSKPEAVVVSYLVFIKQHSSSSQEYSDIAVPVLTNSGLRCPAQDRVHFSEEYGNMDLPKRLPGCDWVLVSPCYVQTDGDVAGWRELFARLGVRDHLIIRKERRTLTASELASSPWSDESGLWPQGSVEGGCVLDDYPSEEFHALATAQLPGTLLLQQRLALLDLLETNWDTGDRYSQYLTAQVIDSDGRTVRSTKSSFFHFLSHLEWVPAYRLLEGGNRNTEYLSPNSVYLISPEVHSLLGTHVCYVDSNPSEFSKALGMRQSVSVDLLIDYLKKWCVKPQSDNQEEELAQEDSEGAEFTSTVQHIHNIYSYLHRNCPQSSLKELFQYTPAIFIEYNRRTDNWCSGRFYHLKEVCWCEPTGMFQRYSSQIRRQEQTVQEPRILAPFYNQLEGMWELFTRQLNVEPSPSMKQYVGLLELICSSSPIPTAEVLQDVSVVYARLAQKCKISASGDQEYMTQTKTNASYCSTLKGMVSDLRVFPTKDNTWVSLARRPLISDSKELEKIFKPYKQACLLNLPPADKKAVSRTKTGNQHGERVSSGPAFSEEDRSLFLEICAIRQLSDCVKMEAQTENLRPCPSMQAVVRSVMPYIQKFLYHHEELGEIYGELLDNNIGEKVKRLQYWQVGKLYIRYQLSVADNDPVVELRDVVCLLKDRKDLYIQKDHLSAKPDMFRELVKLFCTESSHRKELMHFLSGLMTSLVDQGALRRFLQKEDIRDLPDEEELWEVPEPPRPEVKPERALSRGLSSVSTPEPTSHPGQQDGEPTLVCWPPRASILNTGTNRTAQADGVVEAVMKMWPPPAAPKDREPERDIAPRSSSHATVPQSPTISYEENQPPRTSDRTSDQLSPYRNLSHPVQLNIPAATPSIPQISEPSQQNAVRAAQTTESAGGERGEESLKAPTPNQSPPSAHQAKTDTSQPTLLDHSVPEAVVFPTTFQGTDGAGESQRPPLALDWPLWNRVQPSQATLEDLELTCQRPTTVVLSDDPGDVVTIGEWGEQLVNSFLCHWRDSGDPGRPTQVLWCNQDGESRQPYDFKLTFGPAGGGHANGGAGVVYVEVKATVKRERAFIHLSANELDFALKEKERYHIFRVYNAGDAQNVRLCRIQNLAQHLHAKDLELFLFV